LPAAWPDGKVTGLRARGGIEVDITWAAGSLTSAALRADTATSCQVRHGDRVVTLQLEARRSVALDGKLAQQVGVA
jgi:alpha-L-fucosidase 2